MHAPRNSHQAGLDRRAFLQFALAAGLAVASTLSGCGGSAGPVVGSAPTGSEAVGASAPPLFPSFADPPDLSAPGAIPPTEVSDPAQVFGTDLPFLGAAVGPRVGLDTFDHVVVVMFENRAFDHMLGYLYPSGAAFDGVAGRAITNPIPPYAQDADRLRVPVGPAASLQVPLTDPAEQYGSVNVSLFGAFNPPANRLVAAESDFQAPYNLPSGGAFYPPPMDGFVAQFIFRLMSYYGIASPTYDQYATIMQCFTPNLVPVISQVAQAFGVCDCWFCGVPSQTYTNRSFFHAASSSGLVVNSPKLHWTGFPLLDKGNAVPTIFDALTQAGRSWTIYYDELDVISLTRLIHYPTLKKVPFAAPYFKGRLDLWSDIANGTLPDYAFVEPRFFPQDNSYHPEHGAPAVKRGEILLSDLYHAVRASNAPTGSNFQNTLLMATFDEGGTCYDHVPPPLAPPPDDGYSGQYSFGFDRFGQRIPAIFVSAYIDQGSVFSTQLNANSLIRSLEVKWGLPFLTARDAASPTLAGLFNRTTPRARSDWPRLRVRNLSAEEASAGADELLGDEQQDIIGLVYAIVTGQEGLPPDVRTVGDAVRYLQSVGPI